jgi:hypothetical protein
MSRYYVGQVARVTGTITTTKDGKPVDPTKVVGTLIPPDGKATEKAPTKVKSGEYEFLIPVSEEGTWELIVDGIGGSDTANHVTWRAKHRNAPRPSA